MSDARKTNRHQRDFLRRLRLSPHGLPATDWPNPVTLRRWMRRASFVKALDTIRAALVVQSDLQLLSAAAIASGAVAAMLGGSPSAGDEAAANESAGQGPGSHDGRLRALVHLLRLAH